MQYSPATGATSSFPSSSENSTAWTVPSPSRLEISLILSRWISFHAPSSLMSLFNFPACDIDSPSPSRKIAACAPFTDDIRLFKIVSITIASAGDPLHAEQPEKQGRQACTERRTHHDLDRAMDPARPPAPAYHEREKKGQDPHGRRLRQVQRRRPDGERYRRMTARHAASERLSLADKRLDDNDNDDDGRK